MILDTDQLVNAKAAASLCGMGIRNFLHLNGDLRAVEVCGFKFYLKDEVIEWNRNRLAGLKRHWKRHAAWQEGCLQHSPPRS